jgi:uncharacterized protein (TIGR03067 family)
MFNVLMMGLAIVVAAPEAKVEPKKESPKVEGAWVVEKFDGEKKDVPPDSVFFTFKDGEVSIEDGKRTEKASYKVDYTKTPIEIDVSPDKSDKKVLGILKFDSGKLMLAFVKDGGERPKDFKVDEGDRKVVVTLKKK